MNVNGHNGHNMTHFVDALPALGVRTNAPKVERNAGPVRPWLITIVDLMTILLTFFVLMFSMSEIDMAKFVPVARSYGEAFSGGTPNDDVPRLPEVAAVPGDNLSYLEAVLRPAFAKLPSLADVEFRATPQYLILTWSGEPLFDGQSSGFSETARRRVFDLGGVLSNLHNRIAIVGQAPAGPDENADGWRLAITRANAMADAFAAAGYDKQITVLGRKVTDPAQRAADPAPGQVQILIMPEQPAS